MAMSKKNIMFISIAIVVILSLGYCFVNNNSPKENLTYVYEKSNLMDLVIGKDTVLIKDAITVKNNTDKDIYFYMYADVKEDLGLITTDILPAFEENSMNKNKFFIKAKSQEEFMAYFKGTKGTKEQKQDRKQPKSVKFEIVNN